MDFNNMNEYFGLRDIWPQPPKGGDQSKRALVGPASTPLGYLAKNPYSGWKRNMLNYKKNKAEKTRMRIADGIKDYHTIPDSFRSRESFSVLSNVARRERDICVKACSLDLVERRLKLLDLYKKDERECIRSYVIKCQHLNSEEFRLQELRKRLDEIIKKNKNAAYCSSDELYYLPGRDELERRKRMDSSNDLQFQILQDQSRREQEKEFDRMWHLMNERVCEKKKNIDDQKELDRILNKTRLQRMTSHELKAVREKENMETVKMREEYDLMVKHWESENNEAEEVMRLKLETNRIFHDKRRNEMKLKHLERNKNDAFQADLNRILFEGNQKEIDDQQTEDILRRKELALIRDNDRRLRLACIEDCKALDESQERAIAGITRSSFSGRCDIRKRQLMASERSDQMHRYLQESNDECCGRNELVPMTRKDPPQNSDRLMKEGTLSLKTRKH